MYNTPIKTTDLAGIYGALEGNDILTINMYSSPEGDEVGNFDYCGNSGVIVDQNGQYILYGECNMVMDVMRNANGVIQVTLWADTGGEKYCDLIMLKHFRS